MSEESGRPERHTYFMMEMHRDGEWAVPEVMEIRGVRSDVVLDLTRATFAASECVIDVALWLSSLRVIVGPDVELMAEPKGWTLPPDDAGPATEGEEPTTLVVLRGYARIGKVTLERAGA